nr:ABC transporter transmembrane domain-containing protein [Sphingobium bisphenolivorans]
MAADRGGDRDRTGAGARHLHAAAAVRAGHRSGAATGGDRRAPHPLGLRWSRSDVGLALCARRPLAILRGHRGHPVLNDLRTRVFAHVQRLGVGYFDRTKAGRIIARADRDVDTLEPLLIQAPPNFSRPCCAFAFPASFYG